MANGSRNGFTRPIPLALAAATGGLAVPAQPLNRAEARINNGIGFSFMVLGCLVVVEWWR